MSLSNPQGRTVLFAASMVSMVLGSIHAISVFMEPLEIEFATSRANVSLIYATSLVFLTLAVLFGPAIYSRLQPATIYLWVAVLGVVGIFLAGFADEIETFWFGYSIIFGIANGLGYGFGLQFAARANPDHPGLAMGVVTAAYAVGAVLAPYGFEVALSLGGLFSAMLTLGSVVFLVGIGASMLTAHSGARYSYAQPAPHIIGVQWRRIAMIWIAYGSGVAAGLMAIGHAAGIAATAGVAGWTAAVAISGCNLIGSLLSGWLSDKVSHRSILTVLPLGGAAALLALSIFPGLALVFLGVVGFTYGGTIATYPAAIAVLFPGEDGARVLGRVFTAWGIAGLLAPWFAGQIYDWDGSYGAALLIAAGFGILSAAIARKAIV
tara:strand:+ start:1636 stop:2772 length:1137 start_codon:yes stop_codon:yes gene_type:complete